ASRNLKDNIFLVSLTKVKKKNGKETKTNLVTAVHNCVDSYANLVVFSLDSSRSTNFIGIRQKYKLNSRFFFGKKNVMKVALGRDAKSAYEKELNKVSELLQGNCVLMFTNDSINSVIKFFSNYQEPDYAVGGEISTKTVELNADSLSRFPSTMEPKLRKLGLPTRLERGVITLLSNFTVSREGDKLTVEQAKILKLLGEKISVFKMNVLGYWNKEHGFKRLS
uniref:Ribosome assembly factor mrt4 n=1 Tax=Syphacia muris TaxID=451379 RepID=A0A0N5AMJ5_9BILA